MCHFNRAALNPPHTDYTVHAKAEQCSSEISQSWTHLKEFHSIFMVQFSSRFPGLSRTQWEMTGWKRKDKCIPFISQSIIPYTKLIILFSRGLNLKTFFSKRTFFALKQSPLQKADNNGEGWRYPLHFPSPPLAPSIQSHIKGVLSCKSKGAKGQGHLGTRA